ncbi:MAG: Uma2 family endonuclease [Cyclobacteriaceae bacterium]
MVSLLEKPPRTTMEVFKMLPEGTRCELIDNTLYMSPAPSSSHQKTIYKLTGQFYLLLEGKSIGELYPSPIDVFLNEKNAYQPDLVFILNENLEIVKENGIHGIPDLVIEILSPGTKNFDLGKKKKVYEKAGVKEYWVLDNKTKISLGFQLVGKKFEEFKKEKNQFTSALLRHTFKF